MYLKDDVRGELAKLLSTPLWAMVEDALKQREPKYLEANMSSESVAHRSFERKGYEGVLANLRLLTIEATPEAETTVPESMLDPRD